MLYLFKFQIGAMNMKKVLISLLLAVIALIIISVFLIGGQIGAYCWNIAVFIIAPLSVIAFFVELIITAVFLFRKKTVKTLVALLLICLVFALPITVLFGVSPVVYPDTAKAIDSVEMLYPIKDGTYFGGKDYKTHAMWPSERYAYDILKSPYETKSDNLDDYGIFGCEVIAPISGTVTAVRNDEQDIKPNSEIYTSLLGNYIVIKIDETQTYLILAHLKYGSITVEKGSHIEQGATIAQVGNSGTTSEPHLHIQHQRNNPDEVIFPSCAEGLPIIFE